MAGSETLTEERKGRGGMESAQGSGKRSEEKKTAEAANGFEPNILAFCCEH
jgi:hypothetical protein